MFAYKFQSRQGLASLQQHKDVPEPQLGGPQQVKLRIKAVALNYRDLMVAEGNYLSMVPTPVIPGSDAVAIVEEVGPGVDRFKVGDRVLTAFFPNWFDGPPTPANTRRTWGADDDGVLAEYVVADQAALSLAPAGLSDAEAATLPCAGVTAWNALFHAGNLMPGSTVLALGTGGVSIWALQLAKAAGMRTIITSSSAEKLERARSLGAAEVIHYGEIPEWAKEVRRLTAGRGADLVVEVGGAQTLGQSIMSTAMGGTVAIIGGVSGFGTPSDVNPLMLIGAAARLSGIFVGSRAMLDNLSRFVEVNGVRPVVDQVFARDQAAEAFAHLQAGRHFGKVVVQVAD